MAILTGNIIINVYGFNDGEVQTIQTSERASLLSCKFDCITLNKWIVDNIPDYSDYSFRLKLVEGTLLNLKKNINERSFDNSNISELIRPKLYLSLLNDIKRPDGYSDKTYNLYITNSDREESLVAELNIDFEFKSIEKEIEVSKLPGQIGWDSENYYLASGATTVFTSVDFGDELEVMFKSFKKAWFKIDDLTAQELNLDEYLTAGELNIETQAPSYLFGKGSGYSIKIELLPFKITVETQKEEQTYYNPKIIISFEDPRSTVVPFLNRVSNTTGTYDAIPIAADFLFPISEVDSFIIDLDGTKHFLANTDNTFNVVEKLAGCTGGGSISIGVNQINLYYRVDFCHTSVSGTYVQIDAIKR